MRITKREYGTLAIITVAATVVLPALSFISGQEALGQANVNQRSQATQREVLNVNVGNVGVAADVCANANVIGSDVSQSANC
jgi:hypothetical protein